MWTKEKEMVSIGKVPAKYVHSIIVRMKKVLSSSTYTLLAASGVSKSLYRSSTSFSFFSSSSYSHAQH